MLQSPAFIETLWYDTFLEAAKVGRVVQSYINPFVEFFDEWEEEGSCARFGGFSCSSEGID